MRKKQNNELTIINQKPSETADELLHRYIFKHGFNKNKAMEYFTSELLRLAKEIGLINEILNKLPHIKEI